jgi:hypothetical protein
MDAGYTMVVEETVSVLEEVEFCQSHPVWDGRRYIMVRNPVKAISNDASGFGKWADPRLYGFMMDAVGTGGGHLSTGIPVMQSFYAAMRARGDRGRRKIVTEDVLGTGFGRMWLSAQRSIGRAYWYDPLVEPVSVQARLSFEKAFGIAPAVQRLLEGRWSFDHPAMPVILSEGGLACRREIRSSPTAYLLSESYS